MDPVSPRHLQRHRLQVRRHFWRNYLTHSIEGGLFVGGMAFVAPAMLLPVMVKLLGGPAWLIALVPSLLGVGWQLAPLLTAHRIERLTWVKPAVLLTGAFQRLPYLATGLILLYLADEHPLLALTAVAVSPLACGFLAGLTAPAWQELVAKTIPENRLSSAWAVRNIISSGIGLAAGGIIAAVLSVRPGAVGYGWLHLIAFACMTGSYITFWFIRETHLPARPAKETPTLWANLAALPRLLAGDAKFRDNLISRMFTYGLFIVMPFLALHALTVLAEEESYVGYLISIQMGGGIVGNLLAGFLGDRFGARRITRGGELTMAGLLGWTVLAATHREYQAIFFLFGVAQNFQIVGRSTLDLSSCPLTKRATYLALLSALGLAAMLAASGLCALVWLLTRQYALLALSAAASLVAAALTLRRT